MIEVTPEMLSAYTEAMREPIPVRERPARVQAALAAVLAIVERDWNMQPNPNAGQSEKPRWRCNRTSRCIREDAHTGPHAFTGLEEVA